LFNSSGFSFIYYSGIIDVNKSIINFAAEAESFVPKKFANAETFSSIILQPCSFAFEIQVPLFKIEIHS